MPIIYAVLVGLAVLFPEVGHEAGASFESNIILEQNALVANNVAVDADIEQSRAEIKAVIQSLELKATVVPPILKKIAFCESSGQHYTASGSVVTGKVDPRDTGLYQINRGYWEGEANKLGLNLYTREGNEAFALYLYNKLGTQPWNSSKACWSKI